MGNSDDLYSLPLAASTALMLLEAQTVESLPPVKPLQKNHDKSHAQTETTSMLNTPQEFWKYLESLSHSNKDNDRNENCDDDLSNSNININNNNSSSTEVAQRRMNEFSSFVDALEQYLGSCEGVLTQVRDGLDMLTDLEAEHHVVSDKTNSLHETCNLLLAEQSRLDKTVSDIHSPLLFFKELSRIAPLLGLPLPAELKNLRAATVTQGHDSNKINNNNNDILQSATQNARARADSRNTNYQTIEQHATPLDPRNNDSFRQVLERLDECIAFMDDHLYFRDGPKYAARFRVLRFRALALLQNVVVHAIETSAESVLNGLRVEHVSQNSLVARNTHSSLLYVRFRALAAELRPTIHEIEKRTSTAAVDALAIGSDNDGELLSDAILISMSNAAVHEAESRFLAQGRSTASGGGSGGKSDDRTSNAAAHSQERGGGTESGDAGSDSDLDACARGLLLATYSTYSEQRARLVQGLVRGIVGSEPVTDVIGCLRTLTPQLLRLCIDEYQLFGQFFFADTDANDQSGIDNNTNDSGTTTTMPGSYNQVMIALLDVLYDHLRPAVIRQSDLNLLCQCVRTLEGEIIEGQLIPRGEAAFPLRYVLQLVLDDVKEKLAVRASEFIRTDITGFTPSAHDVDYPRKLTGGAAGTTATATATATVAPIASGGLVAAADGATTVPDADGGRRGGGSGGGSAAMYAGWYPTLDRTLSLLSNVYNLVQASVFEDLMEEAVTGCTASLVSAAQAIKGNSASGQQQPQQVQSTLDSVSLSSAADADAQLFLVKHLLILREQITAFVTSAQHVTEKRLDFTPTTSALRELIRHRGMLFSLNKNNAILELVQHGVPMIQENRLDCKKGLEARLRDTCRDLRVDSTKRVLRSLLHFLAKAAAFSPVARVAHGRINAAIDAGASGGAADAASTNPSASTSAAMAQAVVGKRLSDQEFGSAENVKLLLQDCKERIAGELKLLLKSMQLYLRNESTEAILFGPIPTQVFATLNDVKLVVEAEYSDSKEETDKQKETKVRKVELIELLDATRAAVSGLSRTHTSSRGDEDMSSKRSALAGVNSAVPAVSVKAALPGF